MFNRTRWWLTITSATLFMYSCKAVPLTAPDGATLSVQANPRSIPTINGSSIITITLFKSIGDGGGTVADGTQIFLTTDLGIIEERVPTVNGIARATLLSDGRAGQATVTASSGSITTQAVIVEIGSGSSGDVVITVVANPAVLGPSDLTSNITATTTDNWANSLPNTPVIFGTNSGTLASHGAILYTNGNGQAFDRLTLLDDNTTTATVTVTSGNATGSITVTRAVFMNPVVDFVTPSSANVGISKTVTVGGQNFQPGATISFGAGIGIDVVNFVNAESLEVEITIDIAATSGTRDVRVTNPDGSSGTLTNGFTVN